MKTKFNTKPIIRPFFAVLCCFFILQTTFSQPITLTFSGRDAVSGNTVPLQSVMVSNLTQGGDTTVWGDAPTLVLQESSGIFELNKAQNASFKLESNFPNPFAGKTTVTIQLQNRQHLNILLYDQQGAISTNLEQEFSRGAHRFEVAVPQNKLYLLTVSDGKASETLKLFSTAGNTCLIAYTGPDENALLKTGNETTAFVFQPGDMLEYTVNTAWYYEYTTFDNPSQNTDYVFDVQSNTTELPPTVTTAIVTNINATTATSGGNVSDQGSAAVTARGVCWSTSPNPTNANNFTMDGTGTGAFISAITGLVENTIYFVRSYATNQYGTAYGDQNSFTTDQSSTTPFVSTLTVTDISQTSATCGGNVINDGGATVTTRGVCWSSTQNPTINNSHTNNGFGIGQFISNITGLSLGQTYYVRAYATNINGISYGSQIEFMTLSELDYPKLYVPGDYQGWDPASAPVIYDFDNDGIFNGYIYFPVGGTLEFKFTSAPDWAHANYGSAGEGMLDTDPEAPNLTIPLAGGYAFTVDTNNLTWTYELQNWGVIGEWLSWTSDIDMLWDLDNQQLFLTVVNIPTAANQRFKFRANDDWVVNLGAKDPDDGTLIRDGLDIPIPDGGTITFYIRFTTPKPTYEIQFLK